MQTDPDYDVRIAATQRARLARRRRPRRACPTSRAMLKQPPYEAPVSAANARSWTNEMKDGDYRRALRDALAKIK